MRDFIVEDRAHKARDEFIASIQESKILELASSYHKNEPCRIFRPLARGSFNVCFFVEFGAASSVSRNHDRWVVRLPIPSRVPWPDEKIDTEVATMKYVAANTTIPVPKIHAYSFIEDSPIGIAFVIMDFVEGKNLIELGFKRDHDIWLSGTWEPTQARKAMYAALAKFYIQLRRLEFPEIGALGLPTADDDSIRVRHRPVCIEMLFQQIEGLEPTRIFQKGRTFTTAREYVDALLSLSDNLFEKSKNSQIDVQGGGRTLYARDGFKRFVTEMFPPESDHGPFVLMHGDLNISNLLWDENLNLVGVLDWEWCNVVPSQLMVPPSWIYGQTVELLIHSQDFYNTEVRNLWKILRDEELRFGFSNPHLLSQEWAKLKGFCYTLIVCGLLRPEYVFDVYWSGISFIHVGFRPYGKELYAKYNKIIAGKLETYMQDETRQALVIKKEREQEEYLEEENLYFESE